MPSRIEDYALIGDCESAALVSRERAIAGPDMVVLYTPVAVKGENMTTVGEFTVSAGEEVPFVLSYGPSHLPAPEPPIPHAALDQTQASWEEWSSRCHARGPLSDIV